MLQTKNKSSGQLAALKQVDITSDEDLEDYSVEIDILEYCKHENIVALYESFYFGSKLYVSILLYYSSDNEFALGFNII